LGLYGVELKVISEKLKVNLAGLLKEIIQIPDLGRVRLSSIEITEVNDGLINLMAAEEKMCEHLHIPLQSGSDKILKLMNRPYGVKNYELRIKNIRKLMPDIAITTDIIVGFPGETEADFMDTYNFIKEIKFSRLHVFPFSAHEKTLAAKMPGAVSDEIKQRRVKKLKMLGEALSREYEKKFIGRELYVIVSGKKAGDKLIGKSEYYFDIAFDKSLIVEDKTGGKNREKEDDRDSGFTGRLIKVKFSKEKNPRARVAA
jgi:threonylcarbamoyladenosine tRNA methylthiotransferase MtaB